MKKFFLALLVLTPALASAQLGNVTSLLDSVGNLVRMAMPILVSLGLLAFFWGLVKFIFAAGDEESKADGKKIMIWGVVALFVMVSVWGLVGWLGSALQIQQGGSVNLPQVPTR